MPGTHLSGRPPSHRYYLVSRYGKKGLEFPRLFSRSEEEVLTAFSSIPAAREFLARADLGEGWYVREFSCGELVSVIYALCAGVKWVLLDPSPGPLTGDAPALFVWRDSFVDYLIQTGCEKGGVRTDPAGVVGVASG